MPPSEARLYFVVTVKGDLGPFSKQELREQLRAHTFASADRVRNAFGRPLGSVNEVLGNASQTMNQPQAAAAPVSQRRPAKNGPPWPVIAVAGAIIVILLLLWLGSGSSAPAETIQPANPSPPATQPAPVQANTPTAGAAPVRNQPPAPVPAPAPAANGLPAGFSLIDLGDARPKGSADANGRGLIVISGGGSDVWGNHDECAFLYRQLRADSTLTVEVRSMDDTDSWDKAGLMIRGATTPDSMHASILVIHSGLVQFISRYDNGHESSGTDLQLPSFPVWLRLERRGNTYTGSASADGKLWQQVGTVDLAATPNPAVAGLAVSSHNRSVVNRTVFAGLTISENR